MIALDSSSVTRPATARMRTVNVVRLQFVNTQTFIWVPALVLGGAWLLTMLIYWIIQGAGVDGVKIGGGSTAPLGYFCVIGIQAMTMTFPFSQAMSLTRREFYLGSLVAAAVSGLGMSAVFVLTMLSFIIGFWYATIYKRFGTAVLVVVLTGIGLVLVGLVALLTWQQAWPNVWQWVLETGSLGLTVWAMTVSVLLAVGSYLTLRRMPS